MTKNISKIGITFLMLITGLSGCVEPASEENEISPVPRYAVLEPPVNPYKVVEPNESRDVILQSKANLTIDEWDIAISHYVGNVKSKAFYHEAAGLEINVVDPGLYPNYDFCIRMSLRVTFIGYDTDLKVWDLSDEAIKQTEKCEEGYLNTILGGHNQRSYTAHVEVNVERENYTNFWPSIVLEPREYERLVTKFHLNEVPGLYNVTITLKRYAPDYEVETYHFENIFIEPDAYFVTLLEDAVRFG